MKSMLYVTAIVTIGLMLFTSSCKKDTSPLNPLSDTLVFNFDTLSLKADTFWNGADLSGKFQYGIASFKNVYHADYKYWGGFAYSNKHDTITTGLNNQYSVFVSESSSNKFVIAYITDSVNINFSKPLTGLSLKIANDAYTALSMKNGDDYAKKFGGKTGSDPDWFKLTIYGYKNSVVKDSLKVFLADYTAADNAKDYILKTWKKVDLSSFGEVDAITFKLSSSDTGQFGMNTPAYFCIDDIKGKLAK